MMGCHNIHMPLNSLSYRKPSINFTYCKATMWLCYAIITCLMLKCFFRLRPYLTDNYVVRVFIVAPCILIYVQFTHQQMHSY